MAKNKIIRKSIKSINELIKKNLKRNILNGYYKPRNKYFQDGVWGGYQFYEYNSEEMKEMLSFYYEIQDDVETNTLNKEFQEQISDLSRNLTSSARKLVLLTANSQTSHFFLTLKIWKSFLRK